MFKTVIYNICLMMLLGVASVKAQADTTVSVEMEQGGASASVAGKGVADEAYAAGNYQQAIALYEQILHTQGEAAAIYYNLGNSYYKSDNIAKAILNYERALLMNPGDGDIRFNLELARS